MVLRTVSLTIAMLLAALPAAAQKRAEYLDGIYVGGSVGVHRTRDADIGRNGQASATGFKTGAAGVATVGYGFGNGLRAELELGHRAGKVDSIANGGAGAGGKLDATSLMGNVLYDFATGGPLIPYVGAGLGGARLKASDIGPEIGGARVSGSDTVVAYQGIAGLDLRVSDQFAVGASYRYFATGKADIATSAGDRASVPYRDHAVLLGLRYAFNPTLAVPDAAPAAVVVPAPAQQPAPAPQAVAAAPMAGPRAFTVFFDFDKSNITPDADRVLVQAAESAKSGEFTRIRATGHADTAGPPRYNMALSIRRANAVRDVLVREGIPASQIVVVGRGETQLLVPTPDQTREPRNRRVEIVIE
jgi:outer membrane protein OmpA-like peptidoglycan-associated protein